MSTTAPASATSSPAPSGSDPGYSSGQNDPPITNFFSSSGTPALVLAFLAIGLFVGGMVAMFGMRRRMFRRLSHRFANRLPPGWLVPDDPDPRQGQHRRKHKPIGKRPDLWDIYTSRRGVMDSAWTRILVRAPAPRVSPHP